jgi:dihydroneopterin aldolase
MTPTLSLVDLELLCHIGVPKEERAQPQKLLCTVTVPVPNLKKAAQTDNIQHTLNYFNLSQLLRQTAQSKERKLIETLASDLAAATFQQFPSPWIEIEIKKFIIPETRHISLQAKFIRPESKKSRR